MFSLLSNKKRKSRWMLFNLIALLCIFSLSGCRDSLLDTKTFDEPVSTDLTHVNSKLKNQFFKIPDDIRPEFKEILLSIQAQDQANQFVTQEWVAQNGIPIWNKVFSPNGDNTENTLASRSARTVKDMSFIPLKDTITQEIKSFIAVYKVDGNSVGYRLYNKKALLNYLPPNSDAKKKVLSMLVIHAFFEDNINGKKKLVLPAPYNEEIEKVKIKTKRGNNNLNARSYCYEVCIEWNAPIALLPWGEWCYEVCTYDGPISDIGNYGGDSSCSLCRGGLGSNTETSSGGGSSSFTALDGLIYNGSLLSDLSAALDPDGMPLADFERKYPDYAYLVPKLKTLKQFMGDINLENLEYLVRNVEIIEELNTELALDGTNAQAEVQLYLKSLRESTEFKDICSTLNSVGGGSSSSNPLKAVLLDLMVEGAQEWAANLLGIPDLLELRGLLENVTESAGRIAFKATRLIARFIAKKNPVFNALSSFVKAKEVYDKINKAYKVIEQLNNFNTKILEKLISTLKKTGSGKILDRIKDTNNSPNLDGHWDIDMGGTTVDDFIRKLASAFGTQWKSGGVSEKGIGNIFAQHLDLSSLEIKYFEYYPFSGSTGWASIDIVLNNGKQFKFRLGRL